MVSKALCFHPSLCTHGEDVKVFAIFLPGTGFFCFFSEKLPGGVQLLADWRIEVNKPLSLEA
jgi:hypothetical protein